MEGLEELATKFCQPLGQMPVDYPEAPWNADPDTLEHPLDKLTAKIYQNFLEWMQMFVQKCCVVLCCVPHISFYRT